MRAITILKANIKLEVRGDRWFLQSHQPQNRSWEHPKSVFDHLKDLVSPHLLGPHHYTVIMNTWTGWSLFTRLNSLKIETLSYSLLYSQGPAQCLNKECMFTKLLLKKWSSPKTGTIISILIELLVYILPSDFMFCKIIPGLYPNDHIF